MRASMQTSPLLIADMLRHAELAYPRREIVSRLTGGELWCYDYAGLAERARRCANHLRAAGVRGGDRVTSLAWNTHRHLELFFAVPGIGAVLHTANPRLGDQQLAYTIRHAGSHILFYDGSLAALVERLRPALPDVRVFVRLGGDEAGSADTDVSYDGELAAASADFAWPVLDEGEAAFLCYTSGTTGNPKGVLYSHRSVTLHAIAAGLNSAFGVTAFDCLMPCQSMYHATAWGMPFVAAINGCKLVLPADRFDAVALQELIQSQGVTISGGVPTIWTLYLKHLQQSGEAASPLRRLIMGGSAVPQAMAETLLERYGVEVNQIWGMTETSPLGVIATPTPELARFGDEHMKTVLRTRQGRRQFGIQLKVVDREGRELPCDGHSAGSLRVRGAWVIERYYGSETTALDADGWFDTGDIATLDPQGFLRIADRAKDVIKSGGEWVSSIDIENIAASHPAVRLAAVIGVHHPTWEERPIMVLELHAGGLVTAAAMLAHLTPHIPRWWMPDAVFFDSVPLTATGKIDKKSLRERYRNCLAATGVDA